MQFESKVEAKFTDIYLMHFRNIRRVHFRTEMQMWLSEKKEFNVQFRIYVI